MYKLRSNKTGAEHFVDEDGMKKIKVLGWETRYTIVDERVAVTGKQTTMIPDEIKEAARGAATAVGNLLGEQEGNEQPTSRRNPRKA